MKLRPLKYFCAGPPVYGLNVSADRYATSGIRFLRTTDVGNDGQLVSGVPGVFLDPRDVPSDHILRDGDLLLSRSGTLGRSLLFRDQSTPATHAGYLVRFRPQDGSYPPYLAYCAQSNLMQDAVGADAIESTIGNFNAEKYANVRLPWWPIATQRAIADYLDRETSRIDALIAAKRRMAAMLHERFCAYRESVVWNVHARGVTRALRRVCAFIRDGTHQPPQRVEGGYPLLSVRNLVDGMLILRDDDSTVSELDYLQLTKSWRIQSGDVALAIVGATLGKAGVVGDLPPVAVQRSLAILRPQLSTATSRYLYHAVATGTFQAALWSKVAFSAQPGVYLGAVASLKIPLPTLKVQNSMVRDLDATEEWEARAITIAATQIDLLRERRQAVITAAVTGQLMTPEAA